MCKVYFLSTCDTCRKIMKEVGIDDSFVKQDIKNQPLTEEPVQNFYQRTGSFEALVNMRARKLKDVLAANPVHNDTDYKKLLLMDYTFLKRPVFEIKGQLFVGNAKKTVEAVKTALTR